MLTLVVERGLASCVRAPPDAVRLSRPLRASTLCFSWAMMVPCFFAFTLFVSVFALDHM